MVITRIEFDTQSETKEAQNPISALRVSFAPPVYVSGMAAFSELYVTNLKNEQNRHGRDNQGGELFHRGSCGKATAQSTEYR